MNKLERILFGATLFAAGVAVASIPYQLSIQSQANTTSALPQQPQSSVGQNMIGSKEQERAIIRYLATGATLMAEDADIPIIYETQYRPDLGYGLVIRVSRIIGREGNLIAITPLAYLCDPAEKGDLINPESLVGYIPSTPEHSSDLEAQTMLSLSSRPAKDQANANGTFKAGLGALYQQYRRIQNSNPEIV